VVNVVVISARRATPMRAAHLEAVDMIRALELVIRDGRHEDQAERGR